MGSLTFPVKTSFVLKWTLTDASNNPINNAVVTATLYAGRSLQNPDAIPGTVISPVNGLTLTYTPGSNGEYTITVPGTLDPPLDGTGYVLVIDATVSGSPVYHKEQPVVVETAGSLLDLTTVDQIKDWVPGLQASTSDDAVIQSCITAWGFEFLRRTGLGDQGGDFQQSPFNSVCNWDETYDGSGTSRLMLRNRPVTNVAAVMVNGIQITPSSGFAVQGWVLDGSRRSISIRGGLLGWGNQLWSTWQAGPYHAFAGGRTFPYGIQNINVQYSAGYNITPADIVECANKVVAQNYRRRSWVDEESRAMAGGGGTIRYRSWDIPLECQLIVDRYTRTL